LEGLGFLLTFGRDEAAGFGGRVGSRSATAGLAGAPAGLLAVDSLAAGLLCPFQAHGLEQKMRLEFFGTKGSLQTGQVLGAGCRDKRMQAGEQNFCRFRSGTKSSPQAGHFFGVLSRRAAAEQSKEQNLASRCDELNSRPQGA
jgi:hypothetical protein